MIRIKTSLARSFLLRFFLLLDLGLEAFRVVRLVVDDAFGEDVPAEVLLDFLLDAALALAALVAFAAALSDALPESLEDD